MTQKLKTLEIENEALSTKLKSTQDKLRELQEKEFEHELKASVNQLSKSSFPNTDLDDLKKEMADLKEHLDRTTAENEKL